ncbi:MAG: hypothetical protein ACRC7O_18395 [Fimbriiglobus sp.]
MRRTLRLVLGAVVFLAASTALAQTSTDFFPVKKDSKWVYKVGETTIEVKAVAAEKPGEIKLDTVVNGKAVASEVVEVKADGIYRTKINTTPIEPPVKFLELANGKPAAKGATWKVDSKIQQQAVKGTFTVKEDAEKVKVPAGDFDTVVVDGPEFEIAGTKTAVKYWFANGKGIVKLSYSIGGNEAVLELKEYTEGK